MEKKECLHYEVLINLSLSPNSKLEENPIKEPGDMSAPARHENYGLALAQESRPRPDAYGSAVGLFYALPYASCQNAPFPIIGT